VKTINLTCHGLKKLLPYNGFYPLTRTLQIATLLSESLGTQDYWQAGSGTDAEIVANVFPALPDVQGMQALITTTYGSRYTVQYY
jgi:hypothetical protein